LLYNNEHLHLTAVLLDNYHALSSLILVILILPWILFFMSIYKGVTIHNVPCMVSTVIVTSVDLSRGQPKSMTSDDLCYFLLLSVSRALVTLISNFALFCFTFWYAHGHGVITGQFRGQ